MAVASIALLPACGPQEAPTSDAARMTQASAPPAAAVSLSPTPSDVAVIETRVVTETRTIPFRTRTVKDPSLAKGKTHVRTEGVEGLRTLTFEVTYTDGVQTGKRLMDEAVTRAPVTKVVAIGTKERSRCDPNYSGCVPIASDVDCAGGSGNGPAYVEGPVRVIGTDIYGLDRDNDGIACD